MAPILADVNVWLATVVYAHPHHAAATRAGDYQLATFDRGFRRFDRLDLRLLT